MLRTLVTELAAAGVDVISTRDPRLPPLDGCEIVRPTDLESLDELFARGVTAADAVWPTAPECGGILARLGASVEAADRILLGSVPVAVRITGSKRETSRCLTGAGIPVVPTYARGEALPPLPGLWVVKPDDGAGCEGLELLPSHTEATARLASGGGLVAQPWLQGEPWSLSLLCVAGDAHLLACNRQQTAWDGQQLRLQSILANARPPAGLALDQLGSAIAAAIPGLWGYVGVDLVLGANGPVVLEANPRLTTSYCGLPAALDRNVAALILDLCRTGELPHPVPWCGKSVEIALRPEYAA
jgi:tyramine---L-glutamate ligase